MLSAVLARGTCGSARLCLDPQGRAEPSLVGARPALYDAVRSVFTITVLEGEFALGGAMLSRIATLVEEACKNPANRWGYGIWTHHITRVVDVVRRLAPLLGADVEIVELAALLHDYASLIDPALYAEHHLHSPLEAEKILRDMEYPLERTRSVMECIRAHRGSVPSERTTPEAECLASADAITHIEQVPSLLYLAFVQHRMDIDDGTAWVRAKLERSWTKVSPRIRETVRERYAAAMSTLTPPGPSVQRPHRSPT